MGETQVITSQNLTINSKDWKNMKLSSHRPRQKQKLI